MTLFHEPRILSVFSESRDYSFIEIFNTLIKKVTWSFRECQSKRTTFVAHFPITLTKLRTRCFQMRQSLLAIPYCTSTCKNVLKTFNSVGLIAYRMDIGPKFLCLLLNIIYGCYKFNVYLLHDLFFREKEQISLYQKYSKFAMWGFTTSFSKIQVN